MKQFIIKNSFDKADIPVVLFEAQKKGSTTTTFVFFHGLATDKFEYLDFYKILGQQLSSLGHNVISFDARAHGDSRQSSDTFTISNLVNDGIQVIKYVVQKLATPQVTLFGTSFGSIPAVSIAYILPSLVSRVILLAPALDLEKLYLNPINKARSEKYRGLSTTTLWEGKPFKIDASLYFSPTMVAEFALINLPDIVSKTDIKFDVMHGTHDTMIDYSLSVLLAQNKHVTLHTFERMDHGFMDIDDEPGTTPISQANLRRIGEILLNE